MRAKSHPGKNELACPRRREMAQTGQSQATGAPIGGLIATVAHGAGPHRKRRAAHIALRTASSAGSAEIEGRQLVMSRSCQRESLLCASDRLPTVEQGTSSIQTDNYADSGDNARGDPWSNRRNHGDLPKQKAPPQGRLAEGREGKRMKMDYGWSYSPKGRIQMLRNRMGSP